MELHEFHVADDRSRAVGHGDAVARGDVGIRRVLVDLPDAAGGEHDRSRAERLHFSRRDVEHVGAEHAVGGIARGNLRILQARRRDEVDRHVVFEEGNVRIFRGDGEQRVFDRLARQIARVKDAPVRVAAFPRQVVVAVGAFREIDADFDQLADARGSGFDDGARDGLVAESVAGDERVAHVRLEVVRPVEHAGDAALRVIRVGLRRGLFRDDCHAQSLRGGFNREAQPRDAAADDDQIKIHCVSVPLTRD